MNLSGIRPRHIVFAALLIFAGLHLYRFNDPPNGMHQWRESSTASVTLNYYQEDLSFFKPRVHDRGATSGIVASEFPLYNYLSALTYFVIGPRHAGMHLVTVLFGLLGIVMIYRIVRYVSDDLTGAMAAWGLAFAPLLFFYSYKLLPDVAGFTIGLAAVAAYVRYHETRAAGWWLLALVLLAISAAIKPLTLGFLLPLLYLEYNRGPLTLRRFVGFGVFGLLAVALAGGWYEYARRIGAIYGTQGFAIQLFPGDIIPNLLSGGFFNILVLKWPVEIWFGWLLAPACAYGAYRSWRAKGGRFYLWWIVACYVVFVITSLKSTSHDYYTLVAVAPFAALTGLGLAALWRAEGRARMFAIILLVLAPVWAFYRVHHRFGPTDEYYAIHRDVGKTIPRNALVIVDDRTSVDRLYQLNRNGWSLRNVVTPDRIADYIRHGGQFVLLNKPVEVYGDSVATLTSGKPEMIGPLYCYHAAEPDTTGSR